MRQKSFLLYVPGIDWIVCENVPALRFLFLEAMHHKSWANIAASLLPFKVFILLNGVK